MEQNYSNMNQNSNGDFDNNQNIINSKEIYDDTINLNNKALQLINNNQNNNTENNTKNNIHSIPETNNGHNTINNNIYLIAENNNQNNDKYNSIINVSQENNFNLALINKENFPQENRNIYNGNTTSMNLTNNKINTPQYNQYNDIGYSPQPLNDNSSIPNITTSKKNEVSYKPSSSKPLIPRINKNNGCQSSCIRIDSSMPNLTCFRKYSIIFTGVILIIISIIQIILILIDSKINILLLYLPIVIILYGILLLFSVLRIKWIRMTASILGGLFFFGYLFSVFKVINSLINNKDAKVYIFQINYFFLFINLCNIIQAYWGINLCKKNCCY